MPTRPSAERTANSDTPHRRPISACDSPPAASSRIRAVTCGVSFDGPFGPRLPGSSPASPCPAYALRHRQNVAASVPNAAAMSFLSAPVSSASCTAASLRHAQSPAAHAVRRHPVHPRGTAAIPAEHHADPRHDLDRAFRQPRQRQLTQPHRHDHLPEPSYTGVILSGPGQAAQAKHQENRAKPQAKRYVTDSQRAVKSGVLGLTTRSPGLSSWRHRSLLSKMLRLTWCL